MERGIREFDAKRLLALKLPAYCSGEIAQATASNPLRSQLKANPWLGTRRLAVKPDTLFGKRGKNNLILLDADFAKAEEFISKHIGKKARIGHAEGVLDTFLVEPYVPHEKEYYLAIRLTREGDEICLSAKGGVNIEVDWATVHTTLVGPFEKIGEKLTMPKEIPDPEKAIVSKFVLDLYEFYQDLGFVYLEINPFTVKDGSVHVLGMVGKIDDSTSFSNSAKWGGLQFPKPFGSWQSDEEEQVASLDEQTGASLKLTVLNPDGGMYLISAGGGASVVLADTAADLGADMANYGEYSGDPSEEHTYLYAKTIIGLMLSRKGKVLVIGGGIANFTDVAKTFSGIIRAIREKSAELKARDIGIYVRRGGPKHELGLELMRRLGEETNLSIQVYGPETHMTSIVHMAAKELAQKRSA